MTNTWDSFSAENTSLDLDTRNQLREGLISQAEQWLNSFIHDEKDIKINVDVRWQKHLYEAVINATEESNYDLVLKRPNKHSLLDRIFTPVDWNLDRKSTRLNSSHVRISYAVFCLKKKINYIV